MITLIPVTISILVMRILQEINLVSVNAMDFEQDHDRKYIHQCVYHSKLGEATVHVHRNQICIIIKTHSMLC